MPQKHKTAIGDTAISILRCASVMKTKISFALIGETRKKERDFSKKCSANKALAT